MVWGGGREWILSDPAFRAGARNLGGGGVGGRGAKGFVLELNLKSRLREPSRMAWAAPAAVVVVDAASVFWLVGVVEGGSGTPVSSLRRQE